MGHDDRKNERLTLHYAALKQRNPSRSTVPWISFFCLAMRVLTGSVGLWKFVFSYAMGWVLIVGGPMLCGTGLMAENAWRRRE